MAHRFRSSLVFTTVFVFASYASADAIPVIIAARGDHALTLNGQVGDWRGITPLVAVDDTAQVVRGGSSWSGPNDASFSFALARDAQLLYFVAEVHDDQIVRTAGHGANEDALVITLASGESAHPTVYEIIVQPGETGHFPARVRAARGAQPTGALVSDAALAEGSGFTIEASIPLRALPVLAGNAATLRARVSYQDVDTAAHPVIESVIASAPADGQHPGDLPLVAPAAVQGTDAWMRSFVDSYHVDLTNSLLDRPENVAGDAALERVVILPRYIVAAGPGLAGGQRYTFIEHPGTSAGDVLESQVRDVTGDGRKDVILRLLVTEGNHARELLYVYGAPEGGSHLRRIFAHELAYTEGSNGVTDRATFEPNGGGIRVTLNNATGFSATHRPPAPEAGTLATLAPWGENRLVVYRWADASHSFEPSRREPNGANVTEAPSQTMTEAPTSLDAVLRNFRRRAQLPEDARPNFTAEGNLAGDRAAETVQIYGRHLVVVGTNFMNGRSSYSVELPVDNDADVLGMTIGDVTDDGHEDALIRVRRTNQSSVRGHQLDVQHEYLMVYSFDEGHRGRVFAVETARRAGADSITNVVRPPPHARNNSITIEAGTSAGGWNAQTYPFHDQPMAGFEPLLVPWGPTHRVTYRWNGTALVAAP